jgi:type II secretory pathway component PulK
MLVLWMIVVVGMLSSGVVVGARSTLAIAANYRASVIARYAAESGVAVAVAALEDSLAALADPRARRDYLNQLDRALGRGAQLWLGDARAAVALIDVGARLDVNTAGAAALTRLFSFFTDALEAERAARAIEAFIGGGMSEALGLQAVRPLQSLDELIGVPGVPRELAEKAAEFLTVDGDGTINRVVASDTVLAAAGGELRDEPSRILVISRGWQDGHVLTREIQAVYAFAGNDLVLVRWREREL